MNSIKMQKIFDILKFFEKSMDTKLAPDLEKFGINKNFIF